MKKILVIEDNKDVRENLAEILHLSNYQVLSAENGKVGVELAINEKPDLIICDIMMPELDGFGVLHILNKNSDTTDIPFIFLTAKSEKSDFRKGMNLGADDYITKPFDDVELLDAVEMRLKKSERMRTNFDRTENGLNSFINEARGYEALKQLSSEREVRSYRKKDIIYHEGDTPRRLYFISKGKVKIYKTNEEGKEYIIKILGDGDFFGYMALINEANYTESAAALENSEISIIPKEDFMQLLLKNREVSRKMVKMLVNNVTEQEDSLLQMAYNSVRKRVAEAVYTIYSQYQKDGIREFNIQRDDLAAFVGTAKETVIRTLSDFKHERLIDIRDGKIIVLNPEKLRNMPN